MIILPAIDIKDGNCVRLFKGDYGTVQKVAENYMDTALGFQNCGAEWIHMVDLDGAKDATQQNKEIFLDVAKHRIVLGTKARVAQVSAASVLTEILAKVKQPTSYMRKEEYRD